MKRNKLTLAISQIIGLSIIGIHNVNAGDIIVTSTADTHTDGLITFREAIDLSNIVPNSISFDQTVFASPQTITLSQGEINITAGTTIVGPGTDKLTIDGADSSRILTITDNDENRLNVNIDGIKFQNGNGGSITNDARGGCLMSFENLTLTDSIVTDCHSMVDGGGVWNRYGRLTLNNSTISNNTSVNKGGGVYTRQNLAYLTNTTVSGNTTGQNGGGLYMRLGGVLNLSTITNNTSTDSFSGGIYARGTSLILQNSIVAGNNGDNDLENNGNSALLFNSVLGTAGPNIILTNNNSSIGADPELGLLQNNGGTTPTHSISLTSPALNRGDDTCLGETVDQRGELRDDFACDAGSFELQGFPNILVDTVAFDTAADGFCSLFEAVINANFDNNTFTDCATGDGADSIGFSSSLNGETITATNTLSLTSEITFDGPGASQLTLSGGNTNRIFDVTSNSATITINGLSLVNGLGVGGGAIRSSGHLTINNSQLNDNQAQYGGAISSFGSLILNQVSMDNNESSNGGGGAIHHSASAALLQINKSSFTNNVSNGTYRGGGAINCEGPSANIRQSTFVGNTAASSSGGAIHQRNFNTYIRNSTFTNNAANDNGGAIAASATFDEARTFISNATFSGNSSVLGDGASIFTSGHLFINNSILAGNGSINECIATEILNNNNNLVEDGSCNANAIFPLSGDPMLLPLSDNGGFTLTHLPMVGSPVIDAGSNFICAMTDQRDVLRPIDGDANGTVDCDLGSVEVANPDIIFKNSFEE